MLSKIILQANIDKVAKCFEHADKIVIVSHVSPDGDAIGSSLGLLHFLETQGKDVHVIVPNAFPDFLKWMPGAKDIVRYDKYAEFADKLIAEAEVICCLDFNALNRIDAVATPVVKAQAKKILIDHHLNPEDFCQVVVSHPEISSTSELVFRLICRMGCFEDITKEGAFIISELLSKGIDKDEIYRKVFNTYSEDRLRLMGYVLYDRMQVYPQFRAALITLTRNEQNRFRCVKGDTEGFVNIPLQIKNICFSAFLREDTEKNMIKISLRSVGTFPCNKVAAEFFNGGGHLNASGGEYYGTMDEAVQLLKQALVKYEDLLLKS